MVQTVDMTVIRHSAVQASNSRKVECGEGHNSVNDRIPQRSFAWINGETAFGVLEIDLAPKSDLSRHSTQDPESVFCTHFVLVELQPERLLCRQNIRRPKGCSELNKISLEIIDGLVPDARR